MERLDLGVVKLDRVAETVKRFIMNNQYRLPVIIDIGAGNNLKTLVIMTLEGSDFKWKIEGSEITVLE